MKKILSIFCAMAMIFALVLVPTASAETTFAMGDANGDGKVNSDDVIYLLYNSLNGEEQYPLIGGACDFDSDGVITSADAIYLMYNVVYGDEEFPLGADPETALTGLTVNGVDLANFKIIRAKYNVSYLTQLELEAMVTELNEEYNYNGGIYHDTETEESTYEIIVGKTNRKGPDAPKDADKYSIVIRGKKVYLNGGSAHATAMAVSEFFKLVKCANLTNADSFAASYTEAIADYDTTDKYYAVWGDDFSTETLDTSKWSFQNKWGRAGKNGKWSTTHSDPNYVFQQDGQFYIVGHEDEKNYYGGTITTNNTMAFKYGYVENSSLVPDGDGFWSLMWFSGTSDGTNVNYNPEIDLNECFGQAEGTNANVHFWPTTAGTAAGKEHISLDGANDAANRDRHFKLANGEKLSDTFHTYGFLWTETELKFIIDGYVFYTYEITSEEAIECLTECYMYIKHSFSVGRDNNGLDISNATAYEWNNTNRYVVEETYLYQMDDGKHDLIIKSK